MTARPVLLVLAGVNGAGKSSIGGHLLQQAGLSWFNPDTFARELMAATGCGQDDANAAAWQEGVRRFDAAMAGRRHHAIETTLGGRTIPARIMAATGTHDVMVWFCGLATPELHIARVKARVLAGGHDIPEASIRARYPAAQANLIALMPHLAHLQVYDNSTEVAPGQVVPDPVLVAEMIAGRLTWPVDVAALRATPEWAKPLLEAALSLSG
ncbi:MAG TPA: AAA family ATPase [Lysobacter sp.]|nr:AAA family ATPase [Lysobacter sp.]